MYHFIMNPAAASGRKSKAWEAMKQYLDENGIAYEVHVFPSASETAEFVRRLTGADEDVHIIVVGGDGTLNVVLNGIEQFAHTKFSCVRTGSGNDFARNMQIEKDPAAALRHLVETPEETVLDYGVCTYQTERGDRTRRFLISSGIGYDADICEEVSRSRLKKILNKIHMGKLVYVAIGIRQIFTRHCPAVTIEMEDGKKLVIKESFFVVGMIHEMEGGGVPFCPHADPYDGLLSVCVVEKMPRWKLLLAVMLVYGKKHLLFRKIREYKTRKLTIYGEQPQWIHLDGETPCKVTGCRMQCVSGLRFVK